MKNYLEIGKIISTHGLKGELKIYPWCDPLSFICNFKNFYLDRFGEKKLEILNCRIQKNVGIIKFKNIETIDEASKYLGKILYINRSDAKLDENEFFIQDMIGLDVFDYDTNKFYGKISDIFKTGANDVYEIIDNNKKKYLLPAIKDVIIETNIEDNILKIRPIKGIFDDEN